MTSGQVISTPYEMFQQCQDVSGISFFYGSSENINNHVNQFELDQQKRYQDLGHTNLWYPMD